MTRIGLELNSSVVRGVLGAAGDYPASLVLDPPGHDLPLILLLEKSTPELGKTALGVCREKGHLICRDFLPYVGETGPKARRWKINRHKLDADASLGLVFQRLQPIGKSARQLVLTLPSYLGQPQADVIRKLTIKAKLPLAATISAPLAAALIAYAEQAWVSSVVVIDADDHAMTLAHIRADGGQARVQETRTIPLLGLRVWKERLINGLADACVWQTRRDPRDTPSAEQRLYDQLDSLFDATMHGLVVQVGVQGSHWYQNLLVGPSQASHFCGNLLKQLEGELDRFTYGFRHENEASVFVLTHAAGRLPGVQMLTKRLQESLLPTAARVVGKPKTTVEDFGEDLIDASGQAQSGTVILSSDALARAAHGFSQEWEAHCEDEAPLPLPLPADAGPARVHFLGQNFYLSAAPFSLGSHSGCQLRFDANRYPEIAGRHCEISLDKRNFVLHNRSREGTYVNDSPVHHSIILQAGDWIRIGAAGPTVRFLGQTPQRGKATTA